MVGLAQLMVLFSVFTFFDLADFPESVGLNHVTLALLFEFLKLEGKLIDIFPDGIAGIRLLLHVSLLRKDVGLTSGDLLTERRNFRLAVGIRTALFIQIVSSDIAFLLEPLQGDHI